jgi:hypothetical protein
MGLLRFLIIAISIIYILRILGRIFLPFLFKKAVSKMQDKMHEQQQAYQNGNAATEKPQGTISVEFVPPAPKKKPKLDQAGDFVDYEELK